MYFCSECPNYICDCTAKTQKNDNKNIEDIKNEDNVKHEQYRLRPRWHVTLPSPACYHPHRDTAGIKGIHRNDTQSEECNVVSMWSLR